MSLTTKNHTDNVIVGAGELYVDLLDSNDDTTGERFLGDGVGASLSVATERVQVFSGTGPVARKLVDAVRSIERSFSVTLRDMSPENLALFVGATAVEDVADAADVVPRAVVSTSWRTVTIGDDTDLLIDYTPIAGTRKQVKTGGLKEVRAALRYIETPVSGEPRHYYAPLCTVSAGGELGLMSRDTEQQIQLSAAILEPGGDKAALLIDGEAA